MKIMLFTIVLLVSPFFESALGQETEEQKGATSYRIEAVGSAAVGRTTPFWQVSNRYGVVPLEAGNGLFRAGTFHNQSFEKGFYWNAGLDLAVAEPRNKTIFVQQAYAELGYGAFLLSIGSKERYTSILDKRLSSGDMVLSPNARPIPEVNFSMPQFTSVPFTDGWLQIKGDFALGRSFDTDYLKEYTGSQMVYVKNVLWHHKSFFMKIGNRTSLSGTVGLVHWAQWGGESTNPKIGKQPSSPSDFFRVIAGAEGGEDATTSAQINVLGNHYGSFYFQLQYIFPKEVTAQAYHQHYFDDKSGIEFSNGPDGVWGIKIESPTTKWLRSFVIEYLTTKHQSGPIHFIDFDREVYPKGRGGGGDNYYNNGEYITGVSYFGRGIGSPLILSPEYNGNGNVKFLNNRIESWHIGTEGEFSPQLSYRLLFTTMKGWGRHYAPFLEPKFSVASLIEVSYTHPHLGGWTFGGSAAFDSCDMIEGNAGFMLSVSKRGVLKNWK